MFNLDYFLWSSLMGTTLRAAPSKSYAVSTNYHAWIALPTWRRFAPPILFWPWPPYSVLLRSCLTWIFFVNPHWWVPLCMQHPAPSKSHAFSTNYHACIAMATWRRCAPPILLWHWPPFNLFPSSCITLIFFVDSHWWVPLCVQYPTIYMPFRQIIMYILQCPHDIHVLVYLCFVHVQKHAPPRIAGAGHPCSDRSLFGGGGLNRYSNCIWIPQNIFLNK